MAIPSSATLRTVDRNLPRIVHSPSRQSLEASDDYYSFSDTVHSNGSRLTIVPYRTPPSRNISPASTVQNVASQQSMASQPGQANSNGRSRDPVVERGSDSGSPSPGVDDTPFIRFAIDQLTRDEEVTGSGRQGSVVSVDYPVERIVPEEVAGYRSTSQDRETREPRSSWRRDSVTPEFLIPLDPPEGDTAHPPLNFTPIVLQPASLGILIVLCLAMMAGLVFCNVWSQRHDGLWAYDGFGGSRYFVFQFLPQILAAIVIIWTFVVQAAVYRVAPLSIIAKPQPNPQTLQNLPMTPKNFLLPDTSHFRHGEPMVGVCLCVMWLSNFFAIPLQSCLFQVRWFGTVSDGGFKWTSVEGVAWALFSLYALLTASLLTLMIRFGWGVSGLLWDPVSIADVIPLIQRSNVLSEFDRSEVSVHVERYIPLQSVRLGYWRDANHPGIIYGIGKEGISSGPASSGESQGPSRDSNPPADTDLENQCLNSKGSFEKTIHSPFSRYRWAPWFLRDTFVVAWIVIVSVLTIAFVVVSFVKRPLEKGFWPLLPTLPTNGGFSSSNFLYSFIPSLIGTFLFLAWQPIDVYFRSVQSFADLSSPNGATAENGLLLSYNACLPFEVTIRALIAGHYKVAYISFVSIGSSATPVLAGGIFLAQSYSDGIRMSTYLPAYYTLMGFTIAYALSFFIIWPRRKRYLPHPLLTYADIISFLYQSPLLSDAVFRDPKTKADLVSGAVVAIPGEGETARYGFGLYRGRDGREHLGIDRLARQGRPEMMVPLDHAK
ncbi:hypothetical protein VTO42DRAFT_474 [Malbranchea cinnamomea]